MFRMTTLPRRALLVTAPALALGLAASAIAWAAIPDGGGVIHACYKKSSPNQGTLRVIDTGVGQACSGAETPLTWNQTGPQGATGPTGKQGEQGPTGPPGPAGTSATALWAVVDADGTLLAGSGVQS